MTELNQIPPAHRVSVREMFDIDSDLTVPAVSERDDHVPKVDAAYRCNTDVTVSIPRQSRGL